MPALWTPPKPVAFRCRVPGCGATFTEDEHRSYIDHTVACAAKTDTFERHAAMRDDNYFTGIADTEGYRWHRETQAGIRSRPITVPRAIPTNSNDHEETDDA